MTTIVEILKSLGYQTISEEHYRSVDLWRKWYAGHVSSFHDYKVFNGLRHVPCHKVTAGLAKQACEDWADRLMNEKVSVILSGDREQAFFDRVCDENHFRSLMNRYQELSFALGGGAVVARLGDIAVDSRGKVAGTAGKLFLDFVSADGIFPLSWQGGIIRECAFATEFTKGDSSYCYLQLHILASSQQKENVPPFCHCEPVHISRFLEEEPSEAGLLRKGRAAEGASFPDASGKRDDPELVRTRVAISSPPQRMSSPSCTEYIIENHIYRKENECLTEVSLDTVPGFAGIAERFHTGSDLPLFVLFKPNIANNLDPECPLGISVYANAIDQLKTCDNIFDSFNSEFALGRKRIMVKPEGIRSQDGEPYFDPNDLVFYLLPEDAQSQSTVQEMQATLRMEEHLTGMEMALNLLAVKCGFSPGHWELDRKQRTLRTATEVISTNSAEFRTLKKHEIVLEEALVGLARVILKLGNLWFGLELNEDAEITVDFDDSIIEDRNTAFDRDMQMLENGVLTKEEFRHRWVTEREG